MYRYIFEGEGGDQFCGRVACGLSLLNLDEFPALPPHFHAEHISGMDADAWKLLIPGYDRFPGSFKQCVPFFLASIVYHEMFLRRTLPENHPLFNTLLFTSRILPSLRSLVCQKSNNCDVARIQATGIPPFIVVGLAVKQLQDQVREADARNRANFQLLQSSITTEISSLPERLKSTILENFNVQGVHPITRSDFEEMSKKILECLDSKISDKLQHLSIVGPPPAVPEPEPVPTSPEETSEFGTWLWGGRMHPVKEGFMLPRGDIKSFYFLWHFGNAAQRYKPYKFLRGMDMASSAEKGQLAKCRTVIRILESYSDVQMSFTTMKPPTETRAQLGDLFDKMFNRLLEDLYGVGKGGRVGQKSFGTIYNRLKSNSSSGHIDVDVEAVN
jgi:hypothetical protein